MQLTRIYFDLGDTLITAKPKSWITGAKELLSQLKQRTYRLGVLSNTGRLPSRASILELFPADFSLDEFESTMILFSSEVGVAKPSRAIFERAVKLAGVPASQCLYVSENIVETLMAQQVGMKALRVQPPPGNDLPELLKQLDAFERAAKS